MPRARIIPPESPEEAFYAAEFSAKEAEQLAAGDIALLDDVSFSSYRWSIFRLRSPEDQARAPQGGEWEQVAIKHGPIDEEWARATLGGGIFQFRGYFDSGDGRGRTLKRKPTMTLAGPVKNFGLAAVTPPVPAVAPAAEGLSRAERILLRHLRALEQRIGQIERPAPAPAAPSSTLDELLKSLVALDTLRNRNPQPVQSDKDVLEGFTQMLRQGIEIGQARDPAPPGEESTWIRVAEMAMPLLERLVAVRAARRAPGARPAPPPSSATVIEDRPSPEPTPPASDVDPSWKVAARSLARAIAIDTQPDEWAWQLEGILSESDFGMLRLATTEQVIGNLCALAPEAKVLATDHAREYVEAVLAEIKRPPEAEEAPEGSP